MTIKTAWVSTEKEVLLTVSYDNPKGSGAIYSFTVRKQVFINNLTEVHALVRRRLTLGDMQLILTTLIDKVRQGEIGLKPTTAEFKEVLMWFVGQASQKTPDTTLKFECANLLNVELEG